jgi:hypothetical protein
MATRILLTNRCTVPLPWTMKEAQDACRKAASMLLASPWGTSVAVLLTRTGRIDGELVLVDSSDVAGALGYHELSPQGTPYGIVAVKTTRDAGYDPMVTLTHEFFEMAVDPDAIAEAQVQTSGAMRAIAYELSDPVEADVDAHTVLLSGGRYVRISDFVWPSWFVAGSPGPWDNQRLLGGPLTLRPGGYTANYDCRAGWTQQFASAADGRESFRSAHSTRIPKRAARSAGPDHARAPVPHKVEVAAGEPVA